MSWRIFGVFLMVAGIGLFLFGMWLEFEVQAQVGSGAWKFIAEIFQGDDIEIHRRNSLELMIAGPLIYFVGHLLFHILRKRRRSP